MAAAGSATAEHSYLLIASTLVDYNTIRIHCASAEITAHEQTQEKMQFTANFIEQVQLDSRSISGHDLRSGVM